MARSKTAANQGQQTANRGQPRVLPQKLCRRNRRLLPGTLDGALPIQPRRLGHRLPRVPAKVRVIVGLGLIPGLISCPTVHRLIISPADLMCPSQATTPSAILMFHHEAPIDGSQGSPEMLAARVVILVNRAIRGILVRVVIRESIGIPGKVGREMWSGTTVPVNSLSDGAQQITPGTRIALNC